MFGAESECADSVGVALCVRARPANKGKEEGGRAKENISEDDKGASCSVATITNHLL